jgi:DNA polymerase-1
VLPLRILEKQWPLLSREGLLPVFEMENGLIRLLVKMRLQGATVDVDYSERLYRELGEDIKKKEDALTQSIGFAVNVDSPQDLVKLFDSLSIKYPHTEAGRPSFQKEWLNAQDHPAAKAVVGIRELKKLRNTFVKGYLLESNVKGVIHCSFHPMKGTSELDNDKANGAKTGRLSSSDPNLQNIPVRSEEGKKIRKAFVPRPGHARWRKYDYSQIEYRCLAHFAVDGNPKDHTLQRLQEFWSGMLPMWGMAGHADALRKSYNDDASTDYHVYVQENIKALTGIEIPRKPVKNINFGLLYGQTEKALAFKAGFTPEQAKQVFAAYHKGAPYALPTMAAIAREVNEVGFITTFMGRRTRFELWEPSEYGVRGFPVGKREALATWGHNIRRAQAYRGVNYKLQGSAADVIKKAMYECERSGVFDVIGVPMLQVHDELDFSVIDDSPAQREAYEFLTHTLENAVRMRIPIKVDSGDGPNWGSID